MIGTQAKEIKFINSRRNMPIPLLLSLIHILRKRPSLDAPVVTQIPKGAAVTVYGEWQGWYVVGYNDMVGYADASYIQ